MSGRHAAGSELITEPGWRYALVLAALGAVGPVLVAAHAAVTDARLPPSTAVRDAPPADG